MPTIYDVARVAGVSISTVSHVLNRTRRVSAATEQRVRDAVGQLDYRPNSLARALVRQETKSIALIVPDNVNPFYAELARSIENAGFAAGYSVLLCNTDYNLTRETAYVEMLLSKRVDGVIYMSVDFAESRLRLLHEAGIAVVVFDGVFEGLDAVLLDNYQGARQALEHLLALGHRRIACITGPSPVRRGSVARVRAYRDALREAGAALDPCLEVKGDWTYQSGQAAVEALVRLDAPPTAIFACNDSMGIGALAALHARGVAVPAQVSVIGFDNIMLSAFATPPLTTMATPIVLAGQRLCQLLLDRINGHASGLPQRITLTGDLCVRASTGPAPSSS
jgi:LacI family transcriptional regulator